MSAFPSAVAGRVPSLGGRRFRVVNVLLLLLAVGAGALAYVVVRSKPASTTSTFQQTSTVSRGVVLSSVSATGSVSAAKQLSLDFQASGTLTAVDVKPGEQVHKGQVLGQIDSTDAAAAVREAQAGIATAQASLQTALAGERPAERGQDTVSQRQSAASVTSAAASLASARASATRDKRSAQAAVTQARTQLRTDQGNESAAVYRRTQDLGTYASLADAEAAQAAAKATVASDQVRQHQDQVQELDLQTLQTQWTQQLAADKASGNSSGASTDQQTLDSLALQLQQIGKQLNEDAYQLSQDQSAATDLQSTVTAITSDQTSIESLEAKIVSDRNTIATAQANLASTAAKDEQSMAAAQQALAAAKLSQSANTAGIAVKREAPTAATLAQLRGAIVQAEASLASAKRTLAQTVLRAPVAGTIATVNGDVGQAVSGGGVTSAASSSSSSSSSANGSSDSSSSSSSGSAFVTLVRFSSLEVTAPFAESDVAKIAVGDAATVTVSALGSTQLAAHVASINPVGTSSSSVVQYTVTFVLDRTSRQLKPGMTASVAVVTSERDNVLNVPNSYVTGSGQNATVQVMRNGAPQTVRVVAGLQGDSATEIVSGLRAGQTVVTTTTVSRSTSSGSGTSTTSRLGGFGGGLGGGLGGGGFGRVGP